MIRVEKLGKIYGPVTALDGIDLEVRGGELVAYLGPNGAGKTTTIRILTGLTALTSGRGLLNGHDITKEPLAAKKQYGLVPQHLYGGAARPGLIGAMSGFAITINYLTVQTDRPVK